MRDHHVPFWIGLVLAFHFPAPGFADPGGGDSSEAALYAVLNAATFTSLSIVDDTDPLLRELLLEDFAHTPTIKSRVDVALNDLPFQLREPALLEQIDRLALRRKLDLPPHEEVGLIEDAPGFDIPLKDHPLVETYIDFFSGKGRWFFAEWLARSHRYIPIMQPILEKAGLPKDLVYLAMIESGFSSKAHSSANASGFWQFIPSTGRSFHLEQSFWRDDRRDFILSTEAAARYLKRLHRRFGDWHLAWACYNAGPGRIARALRKYGESDFWSLIDNHPESIARETRHYVPKVIAAAIVAKSPELYGFPRIKPHSPLAWRDVPVKGAIELRRIVNKLGISAEELRTLNPSFLRGITPPGTTTVLRIPPEHEAFVRKWLKTLPQDQRYDYVPHRVRKGETLSGIAREYRTSVKTIKAFNRIQNPRGIRPGKVLLIPSSSTLRPPRKPQGKKVKPRTQRRGRAKKAYVVVAGDTLWSIARRHDVTVKELKQWNGRRGNRIRVGDRLYVF